MRQERIAVSLFFGISGFIHANWTARLPELQRFLGINNAELGLELFLIAGGAMLAMPLISVLSNFLGSKRMTLIGGIIFCGLAPFIAYFPNPLISSFFFGGIGFFNGILNVSMNGQAVLVEREFQRPIMSSFHALFSIGMAVGALSGALFARMGMALFDHLVVVCTIGFAIMLFSYKNLVSDTPKGVGRTGYQFRIPGRAILPLGLIGFCSMTAEGSMGDWSAIYMHTVVGESEAFSALAFGIFGVAMTVGRLGGDFITGLVGKFRMLVLDTMVSGMGLGMVLLISTPIWSMIGFFLVGIGLATIVPIIYSTAGNLQGINPSAGIAMVTSLGYVGFFIGPPVIGLLSDFSGLRIGLGYSLLLLILMGLVLLKSGVHRQFSS